MIVLVAWRNIWRNKSRSMVVVTAMVVAVVAVLFMMAFMWGMTEYRLKEAIEKETSHIQIHHKDFKENFESKFLIQENDKIVIGLENDERVVAASKRLIVTGMAQTSRSARGVMIHGVDFEAERLTTSLDQDIIEGSYFGKTRSVPIILGKKLAENLKIELKKKVILRFQDIHGEITLMRVKVMGIYETNNSRYDGFNVFIPEEALREMVKIESGYNEIALKLKPNADINEVKKDYEVSELNSVETWKELSPELALTIDTFDKSMIIIVFIFFFAVALVIVNIMLMAVLERVREIGMLMAIGMNKVRIFSMFMLETLFLALVGLPLGLALGHWVITVTGESGIDLSRYGGGLSSMGYGSVFYPSLPTEQYWSMAIQVMLIIFIAAIVPARRALKLKPATAIRKI